jgi:tetratricopeptide (TPR) repeat protein
MERRLRKAGFSSRGITTTIAIARSSPIVVASASGALVNERSEMNRDATLTVQSMLPWLIATSLALAACHSRPRSDGGPAALTGEEARAICLSDPRGGLPIDEALRDHQRRARRLADQLDEWLVVGKGWVTKARRSADPGFYVNVDACASAALQIDPGSEAALELRGLALMNDHRFADARDTARTILAGGGKDAVALGTLSDALLELGDFDASAAATQDMVDLRPDMSSYSRAAYLRWLQGDRATAKQFLRLALNGRDARDPEPAAWTLVQAGTLYWQEGDYSGADAVFAEALRFLPDYPPALVGRGRVALSRQEPAAAATFLEHADRINPLVETAWLLGDAHEMAGGSGAGNRDYDRAIQEGRRTDRLTLALFYATKNRDQDEALRLIEAERTVRGGVYVDDAYAWALFRSGRIGEARLASERALRLGTPDARLMYHAGAIRLAAGEASGRELVRRALSLNPHFDWSGATEATRLLADGGVRGRR